MPFTYTIESKSGRKTAQITGYDGTVRVLSVPSSIDGVPVTSIGGHAFAGRQDIEEAVLPESITQVRSFAFHNDKNLRKLSITDHIRDWYQGVIRQCGSLRQIEYFVNTENYSVIRQILSDSDSTLELVLRSAQAQDASGSAGTLEDGEEVRLVFPDYAYISQENTMARCIQFTIEGAGMGFREAVGKRSIDYRGYDRMFTDIVLDNPDVAGDIAVDRLLYPHDLAPVHREAYETFARRHADSILVRLVQSGEKDKIRLFTRSGFADSASIESALKTASDLGETEICAILMEAGRQKKKPVPGFDLGGW